MQKKLYLSVVLGTLQILSGCNGKSGDTGTGTDAPPPATADAHDHPSEGPHHGALIELGNESFHAELVHTGDTVTVYILDHSATRPVPIDAQDVTINLLHENQPEQFKLPASPEASDGVGKSSRFVLQAPELVEHLDSPATEGKLMITVAGTPYRGELRHAHDHAGHDHAEHDHEHEGHDH